jgi:hypothetical protein
MTSLQRHPDKPTGERPSPLLNAAMQYAANEIPVVVFDAGVGNHKQCGNLVGNASVEGDKWHEHVSTDATVIAGWFDAFGARVTGIATSPGAADCVVLDVDRPEEVPEHWWPWLDTAPFQSTRIGDDQRGHYWFDQPPGERIGCPVMEWGEVRGDGGGLILSPTRHAKADGRYQWRRQGDTHTLPDAITAELRARAQRQGGVVKVTDAAVTDFAAKHVTTTRPGALAPIVARVRQADAGTRDAARGALCQAARGARVGKFGWTEARDAIEAAARESYERRGGQFDPSDLARLERYAIEQAMNVPLGELEARENRPLGTDTRNPTTALDIESVLAASGIISGETDEDSPADAGQSGQSPETEANGLGSGDSAASPSAESFWSSSRLLTDLRTFARARRVGPYAMLGHVLARVVAAIPPTVVLPPLIGSHASLNLFVALVGPSGSGKGGAAGAAAGWLATQPETYTATLGSGEGMAKCYAHKQRTGGNGPWVQTGLRASVLFDAPEVDNLAALSSRSSSTLLPQLRSAYSGEELGFSYADPTKAVRLCAHRYRLCLTVGVQPGRGRALLDDADGGTPQRFVWLPTGDPDAPDVPPGLSPRLTLTRWPDPVIGGRRVTVDHDSLLNTPATPPMLSVLDVPDAARAAIDHHRVASLRGEPIDPLDGHRLLCRLKIAAALMALHGRTGAVTESDWERAGIVTGVSDATRQSIADTLSAEVSESNRNRGRMEGERADIAEQVKENRALKRIASRILKYLQATESSEAPRAQVRRGAVASRDRDYFDDAEALLIGTNRVEKISSDNDGPDGHVLRLSAKAGK